ncbi:helix-turn-helix transcriptional regulator [Anoxybacillus sp. B7M1]|uniref:helix-turn-helix transcriptional regulator n=1 Tax=Anoxybacillus sp. B7M1 TaxID=1490057 RepID=UPI001E47E105|nr:helix-turn-helix transcriptional regulator [Anoxybacillus sp. B7M1]
MQLRKERNLTQNQAANCVGIKRSTYACIEKGLRNPSLQTAAKIADFFDIPIEKLVQ